MIESNPSDFAKKLISDTLVWDAHAGIFPDTSIDLNVLDSWRAYGVDYLSINVGFDVMDWQQTLKTLAAYRRWLIIQGEHFVLAATMKDVVCAKQEGKLAVSFDIEGMNALNGDINLLGVYHRLGVRQMLFAYNLNNQAAGGCHDTNKGLTKFGVDIVAEMNRLGMIVDCSHAAPHATLDIMSASIKPVVFSHSNPSGAWSHQRNISDQQIKACAKTGGVIGINGLGIFLGDNDSSTITLVKHVCYVADLVGSEHVGLGFDYSPKLEIDIGEILRGRPDYWPDGQAYDTPKITHAGPSQLLALVQCLLNKGFKESEIRGIIGENFHRLANVVWAKETQ